MCLEVVRIPEQTDGVGYKVFDGKRQDGTYTPRWPYFRPDGRGGVGDAYAGIATKNDAEYRLGETYVVNHDRTAIAEEDGKPYRAGVHLYKTKPEWGGGYIAVRCQYRQAVAEDDHVVVALEVTPLEEV